MLTPRVIPCLLLKSGALVKTVRFRRPTYVGDPLNACRIFNEKEVDELVLLDIGATAQGREPDFDLLGQLAAECFMPVAYGGGVSTVEQIGRLFELGLEKVVIGARAVEDPDLIRAAADRFGSQSIVVCIDVKRRWFGKQEVVVRNATRRTGLEPRALAESAVAAGAGELMLNSVDRDGTRSGYDLDLVRAITSAVDVPVIASGGAGALTDIKAVIEDAGASSAAAGSLFVFHGKHRAVLVNYPARHELERLALAI